MRPDRSEDQQDADAWQRPASDRADYETDSRPKDRALHLQTKNAARLSTGFQPPPFGGIGSSKQPQCPEPPRMAQRNVPQTRMVGISLSSASSLRWLSTWPNGSSRSWGSPWQGVSREYLILYGQNAYFASSHQAIKTRRSIENSVIQVDRLGCCDLHILSARVGADREIA